MKTDLQFWTETYQFWRKMLKHKEFANFNHARSRLVAEIRKAERKLGREYRHLPKAGIWQGLQCQR